MNLYILISLGFEVSVLNFRVNLAIFLGDI
jgi:hypothetical protein